MPQLLDRILEAHQRLSPLVRRTPLEPSPWFSRKCGARVFLKLENFQRTGSFKVRGALNKLLCLAGEARARGIVTASSGNHGAAVAYGMARLGISGEVWVPENASPAKVANIRAQLDGAAGEIRFHGTDSGATEVFARRRAEETGRAFVSPYNDLDVVAGQGSLGVEVEAELGAAPDALCISVGGGGLIAGVATYLRARNAALAVIGSQPIQSAAMAASLKAGRVVPFDSKPTLSDGTAGDVEEGAITFPLCQRLIDEFVLLSEEEIARAMRETLEHHHMLVEGAAGVALASLEKAKDRIQGKTVVVVLCGANLSLDALRSVLGT